MKKRWIFVILALNAIVAITSIIPLLENKNRTEWFGTWIYQILLLIGWVVFFLITLLCGLILRKSRYHNYYSQFRKAFGLSVLVTIPILVIGVIKHQTDFSRWQNDSYSRRVMEENAEARKFKSTVDSLKNTIIASDSTLAEPFFQLGLIYLHNGNWNESVENYKYAITLDKTKSSFFSELGYSESFLGQYEEAIKSYEKAYQLDSTQTWILNEVRRCSNLKMRQN